MLRIAIVLLLVMALALPSFAQTLPPKHANAWSEAASLFTPEADAAYERAITNDPSLSTYDLLLLYRAALNLHGKYAAAPIYNIYRMPDGAKHPSWKPPLTVEGVKQQVTDIVNIAKTISFSDVRSAAFGNPAAVSKLATAYEQLRTRVLDFDADLLANRSNQ